MNTNIKHFIFYLAYTLAISYLVIIGNQFYIFLHGNPFEKDFIYMILFWVLFPILVGLLIALPQLIIKAKKPGQWGFNWVVFLAVGLPTLYVCVTPVFYYFLPVRFPLGTIIMYDQKFHPIFGVVFGYALLTAFNEQKSE